MKRGIGKNQTDIDEHFELYSPLWKQILTIAFYLAPIIIIPLIGLILANSEAIDNIKPITQVWIFVIPCAVFGIWWFIWRIKRM